MFDSFLETSLIARGIKKGILDIKIHDLRKYGLGPHRNVDATPYGGGPGMVLRVDVIEMALNAVIKAESNDLDTRKIILLTPQGQTFNQTLSHKLSRYNHLIFICGHYEGFDERIRSLVDMEISLGDFVLTGGELASQVIIDSMARLLPDFLGKEQSNQEESFSDFEGQTLLEYPHYTRPEIYAGQAVPKVLLSGNHGEIKKWRYNQALERTKQRRPDLLKNKPNQIDKSK